MSGEDSGTLLQDAGISSGREIRRTWGIRVAGIGFLMVFLSGGLAFLGSGVWAEIVTGIGFILVAIGMLMVFLK
ncbi:MAG: hypothetical protein ABFC24_01490 [Methanoregulaceae archaeon]